MYDFYDKRFRSYGKGRVRMGGRTDNDLHTRV